MLIASKIQLKTCLVDTSMDSNPDVHHKHGRLIGFPQGHFKIQYARFMPVVNRTIVLKIFEKHIDRKHKNDMAVERPWTNHGKT